MALWVVGLDVKARRARVILFLFMWFSGECSGAGSSHAAFHGSPGEPRVARVHLWTPSPAPPVLTVFEAAWTFTNKLSKPAWHC